MNLQNSKRFYIHTLGCKVNQYDTQVMREMLTGAGFMECLAKDLADIYIVNTCSVTEKVDKESRRWISRLHKSNPDAKIVVTGCYAETDASDILILPGIAHIIKNSEKNRIVDILNSDTGDFSSSDSDNDHSVITDFRGHAKAFVKIQDGCDNRCSYCKVPSVRGPVKSKPVDTITREVAGLVKNGFKEIVLTGICMGSWGKDLSSSELAESVNFPPPDLVDVLRAVDGIDGDFRVRLSSIEPRHVTDKLIDFMASYKRMCRHLHIPLQSGDDEILKKMNRPYTSSEYAGLIKRVRDKIEGIAVTTDVMIAFPGESGENFSNTLSFIKAMLPSRTHIFPFSKRKGTPAFAMGPDVGAEEAKGRYDMMRVAAIQASYIYRAQFIDKTLDVLVENKRDKTSGNLTGYSDNYIKVQFHGPDSLMKTITPVRIVDANLMYTTGALDG